MEDRNKQVESIQASLRELLADSRALVIFLRPDYPDYSAVFRRVALGLEDFLTAVPNFGDSNSICDIACRALRPGGVIASLISLPLSFGWFEFYYSKVSMVPDGLKQFLDSHHTAADFPPQSMAILDPPVTLSRYARTVKSLASATPDTIATITRRCEEIDSIRGPQRSSGPDGPKLPQFEARITRYFDPNVSELQSTPTLGPFEAGSREANLAREIENLKVQLHCQQRSSQVQTQTFAKHKADFQSQLQQLKTKSPPQKAEPDSEGLAAKLAAKSTEIDQIRAKLAQRETELEQSREEGRRDREALAERVAAFMKEVRGALANVRVCVSDLMSRVEPILSEG
jgi:hypothetical protein